MHVYGGTETLRNLYCTKTICEILSRIRYSLRQCRPFGGNGLDPTKSIAILERARQNQIQKRLLCMDETILPQRLTLL